MEGWFDLGLKVYLNSIYFIFIHNIEIQNWILVINLIPIMNKSDKYIFEFL